MELEDIILNEISQTETENEKYYMESFQVNLKKKVKLKQTRKFVAGAMGQGKQGQFGKMCKLPAVKVVKSED